MSADPSNLVGVHQRVDGEARIAFRRVSREGDGPASRHRDGDYGKTALADLYQRAPCRVLFPTTESDEPIQAVLLTTCGGLTGGDRTRVSITVAADAQATATTQAAEKIYRALPNTGDARVEVDMSVSDGAWAEWLAQETILFDGSRLRRSFTADVAATGRLLAVESIVFGRTAMGESFDSGLLHDAWRIRRGGRLIWADALRLEGDVQKQRAAPFGFGTHIACSTVLYIGADASQQVNVVRELLEGCDLACGATSLDGILLVRIMADEASKLRAVVMKLIAEIRHTAAALPARLPRVWHC